MPGSRGFTLRSRPSPSEVKLQPELDVALALGAEHLAESQTGHIVSGRVENGSVGEADEFRATLVASLRRLRDDDRLILAYRLFFDLSEAEMAEALKCPKGTVKSRLSRALGRLRAVLPADLRLPAAAGETDG